MTRGAPLASAPRCVSAGLTFCFRSFSTALLLRACRRCAVGPPARPSFGPHCGGAGVGMVVMAAGGSAVNGAGRLLATPDDASKGSDQSVRLGQGTGVARDPMDDAPRPLRKVRQFSPHSAWQSPGLSQWRRASLCDRRGFPSRRGDSTCQSALFFHPSPATSKAVYHPTASNLQPHTSSQRPHDRHRWREKPTTRAAAAHHSRRCGDMHQPKKN